MDGNTTSHYVPTHRGRDSRIDLARGLALLIIFVDHNSFLDERTFRWPTAYTLGRFSFIDAADVFFFISGYVSGLIYTKVLLTQGLASCLRKAFKRCVQLYVAEIVLFLLCLTLILSTRFHGFNTPWVAFQRLRDHPVRTLLATFTLANPPSFFGLLPIYMLFIGLTPAAIWLWIRRPIVLIAISVGLYITVQSVPGLHAYTYDDGFNPMAWQLVFFGGIILGAENVSNPHRRWNLSPRLVSFAFVGIFTIAFLRLAPSEKIGTFLHTHALVEMAPKTVPHTGKSTVEPFRLLNLLFWVIVFGAISPGWRLFKNGLVRMVTTCGENSLIVFCASVFLNYVVLIYSRAAGGGRALQLAWTFFGCALLIGTAYGWKFLKQRAPDALNFPQIRTAITPHYRHLFLLVFAIWQGLQGLFNGNIGS